MWVLLVTYILTLPFLSGTNIIETCMHTSAAVYPLCMVEQFGAQEG